MISWSVCPKSIQRQGCYSILKCLCPGKLYRFSGRKVAEKTSLVCKAQGRPSSVVDGMWNGIERKKGKRGKSVDSNPELQGLFSLCLQSRHSLQTMAP